MHELDDFFGFFGGGVLGSHDVVVWAVDMGGVSSGTRDACLGKGDLNLYGGGSHILSQEHGEA